MNDTGTQIARIIAINRRRIGLDPADDAADVQFSKSTGAASRLCVYGRMREGGPDAHVLEPLGGTWADCAYPGFTQNDACTMDVCPGLAWTPTRDWNAGFLLIADGLQTFWDELDINEGAGNIRLLTPVRVGDDELIANIYASRDASETQLLMLDGMNVHDDVD